RFSCSITRTSGKRSRTSSSVPSVEPWSTTIVGIPRRLSRQRSSQGRPSSVTVTAVTSALTSGLEPAGRRPSQPLDGQDHRARQRERDRDDEEQEARREGWIGADVQLAEEADEEGLADGEPVDRERDEHDQEEQRAHHVVDARREVDADRLRRQPDREHAHGLDAERQHADAEQEPAVVPVSVDPLVDGAQRALDPQPPEQRNRPSERPPHAAREEDDAENDGRDDEGELDPEVGADVVAADREHEPDRREGEGRRAAERALEQHRPRDRPTVAGVPPRRLEDPHRVAADRGREDLAGRVRREVRPRQPRQPVVDAAAGEQLLPAPRHRQHGDDHDRDRPEEVADVRAAEDVERLADVDLPDDVDGAEAGDDERRDDADRAPSHAPVNAACTRRSASIASWMSCSECAAESGSENTSAPARSATGSGGWSGKRSRYAVRRCTGRKWTLVPIFSPASASRYSSRVAPARSGSTRTTYRWCACRSRGSRATGSSPSSSATAASSRSTCAIRSSRCRATFSSWQRAIAASTSGKFAL